MKKQDAVIGYLGLLHDGLLAIGNQTFRNFSFKCFSPTIRWLSTWNCAENASCGNPCPTLDDQDAYRKNKRSFLPTFIIRKPNI